MADARTCVTLLAMRRVLLLTTSLWLATTGCDTSVDNSVGFEQPDAGPIEPTLANVQGLFDSKCAGGPCHVDFNGAPAGNLDLSGTAFCSDTIGVPAAAVAAETLVVRNNAQDSYLLCKMLDNCENRVGSLMPLGAARQLPPVQLDLIRDWIDKGAPGCP
jgi:hypothetical protein